jgi:hypothetical protein
MPVGGPAFSSVRKARAALKEQAEEILREFRALLKQAAAAGDYETAAKGYIHLLEHMPAEEGEALLDGSIDKKQIESKTSGPAIQIGVQIGGLAPQRTLPEPIIIDVQPSQDTTTDS